MVDLGAVIVLGAGHLAVAVDDLAEQRGAPDRDRLGVLQLGFDGRHEGARSLNEGLNNGCRLRVRQQLRRDRILACAEWSRVLIALIRVRARCAGRRSSANSRSSPAAVPDRAAAVNNEPRLDVLPGLATCIDGLDGLVDLLLCEPMHRVCHGECFLVSYQEVASLAQHKLLSYRCGAAISIAWQGLAWEGLGGARLRPRLRIPLGFSIA